MVSGMGDVVQIIERPQLRGCTSVFRDRAHAGDVLAEMLRGYEGSDAQVLAIPAGGVPVAVRLAQRLGLPVDVSVVSKITKPGDTESGYGAVAYDGTVSLDDRFIAVAGLERDRVDRDIELTRQKVMRRGQLMRGDKPAPVVKRPVVILVDDGLASGLTMDAAIRAVRGQGAAQIVVAVPTGHEATVHRIAQKADTVVCANIRSGRVFAVADAYAFWDDVDEADAARLLASCGCEAPANGGGDE